MAESKKRRAQVEQAAASQPADEPAAEPAQKTVALRTWDEGARRRALLRRWEGRQRPHSTGMVDYGLWVRMFNAAPTSEDEPYRRGLISH